VLVLHQVGRHPLEEPVERLARDDLDVSGLFRGREHVRPELRVRLDLVDRDGELLGVRVDEPDVLVDRLGRRGVLDLLAVERPLGKTEVGLETALDERVVGDVVEQVLDRVDDRAGGADDVVRQAGQVTPPPAVR